MKRQLGLSLLLVAALAACTTTRAPRDAAATSATASATTATPPVAARKPYEVKSPNGTRIDDYYWLRDDTRKNPEMLAHLNAERDYADAVLAPLRDNQRVLLSEIIGRIKQDDASVPTQKGGYWYYSRFETGAEYAIHARRQDTMDAPEQILLDGPRMAKGKGFFQIANYEVSLDGNQMAWAEDTVGRRQFVLRFKNLATGEEYADRIENVEAGFAWANDNRTVLYVEKDPVTLLSTRVRAHVLGTPVKDDRLIYEEKDHAFYLGLWKSRSDRFINIGLESTVSSEQWVADANDPKLAFRVLVPRSRDHLYQAEDMGNEWIIRTNWQARNFRIVRAEDGSVAKRARWRNVIPHREAAFVEDFQVFKQYLALTERSDGLRKVRLKAWRDGRQQLIAADDPTYSASLSNNPEVSTHLIRYFYTSMTTPGTTYDFDTSTGEKQLLKREPVLGDFDPANYVSEYVHATARDGTKIPVSLVYRKGFQRDGKAALYQYAYGSYGISSDPRFCSSCLSLLDRGMVFAIAHIRGGQEMGRDWYDNGKLLKKMNTFTDFIDVTDFLVQQGYAARDRVVAAGGSAGGLLMGAIANLAPDRYRAIAAHVPFVDVVTTMLDESIPLTTNEFDEWGNPKEKQYYDYMLTYSPYDNVRAQDYPAMLVTTGLWDSQVQYFEPAKWVAKLRATKTDQRPLIFHINMEAGHGGKSGRFQRQEETAEEYAFLLDQLQVPVHPLTSQEKH